MGGRHSKIEAGLNCKRQDYDDNLLSTRNNEHTLMRNIHNTKLLT